MSKDFLYMLFAGVIIIIFALAMRGGLDIIYGKLDNIVNIIESNE